MRRKPEVTTAFFVPQSRESLLFKLIQQKETKLGEELGWKVKILEAPGLPILNKLTKKFPLAEGCPKGKKCILCDNKGITCATEGIVYRVYCESCKRSQQSQDKLLPTYVGESSRPWRERTFEHMNGINLLKTDSVFVQHWMEVHGTQTTCPKFKFKIVQSYPDALRHQICEALYIMKEGTLNRKQEFISNEICSLEPVIHSKDLEADWREESIRRKRCKEDMNKFCAVMNEVKKSAVQNKKNKACPNKATPSPECDFKVLNKLLDVDEHDFECYRFTKSSKRELESNSYSTPRKRLRAMETSTPKTLRGNY